MRFVVMQEEMAASVDEGRCFRGFSGAKTVVDQRSAIRSGQRCQFPFPPTPSRHLDPTAQVIPETHLRLLYL